MAIAVSPWPLASNPFELRIYTSERSSGAGVYTTRNTPYSRIQITKHTSNVYIFFNISIFEAITSRSISILESKALTVFLRWLVLFVAPKKESLLERVVPPGFEILARISPPPDSRARWILRILRARIKFRRRTSGSNRRNIISINTVLEDLARRMYGVEGETGNSVPGSKVFHRVYIRA